jgi:hypothetical protein
METTIETTKFDTKHTLSKKQQDDIKKSIAELETKLNDPQILIKYT